MRNLNHFSFKTILMGSVVALFSCNQASNTAQTSKPDSAAVAVPDSANFKGTVADKPVKLYTLSNSSGAQAAITNYGGRIVSLLVPDKSGKLTDVVLGYDKLESYQKPKEPYFGALIGRYGNRIAKGKFKLAGKSYQLDINDGVNTLHGGFSGFYSRVWDAQQISKQQLKLTYLSKDMEGGYPGNLSVQVTYTLTDDNSLKIEYQATTDKPTVVNLTNHAYFNLSGAGSKTILDNLLKIKANRFTPIDTTLIPTGKLQPVKGTPFDFTDSKAIGRYIAKSDDQLKNGKGYDHNFVLDTHTLQDAVATVTSPVTGISMDIYTTEPGLQFYTGNFLTGATHDGKKQAAYPIHSAICLETQHFPDSPNQPSFPTTTLNPGKTYTTTTIYKFYTEKK